MREMKDSGIEWIGEIPKYWEIVKNKYFAQFINGYAFDSKSLKSSFNVPVIRIGDITDKEIDYKDCLGVKTNDIGLRKYRIKDKDIVIAMSGATVGKTCIASNPPLAFINQRVGIVRTHSPRFLHYCLSTKEFVAYILLNSNGSAQPNFSSEIFKNYFIPNPSEDEQQAIANFLDAKCADIDSLTADIQKQINILKEYKKSVITRAVTKGLDPNVEMKDSGIYGADKIPKHWKVKRNKFISTSLSKGNGITKDQVTQNGDTECIRYGEIYTKYDKEAISIFSHTNLNLIDKPRFCRYGDILFTCTGELIEEIGKNIVYLGNKKCMVGGDIIIMQHSENPKFLNYALSSSYSQNQKSKGKAKLKVVHISSSDIGNILIALPPLKEQQVIADYLDAKCADIDAAIVGKQKQLDVLKEYKKSLIYEYVTGKKEVPCHE